MASTRLGKQVKHSSEIVTRNRWVEGDDGDTGREERV